MSPRPGKATARKSHGASASALAYAIDLSQAHAHRIGVTLTIERPQAQQVVSLPAWIPGSYLIREFARHLMGLHAVQEGKAVALTQLDKASWRIDCSDRAPLTLHYAVYAHDASVRTAWLDAARCFFNPTSVCLQVQGQTDAPHSLLLHAPQAQTQWQVATGLLAVDTDAQGWGHYRTPDYDALADSPVEIGDFWSGSFTACGIAHRFVVAGAGPGFDGERLLADTQKICEAQLRFWHGSPRAAQQQAPHREGYVFMLWAVDQGYGGLEHRNSTALIAKRSDLPTVQGTHARSAYIGLLGLISHEYFHTWNVKQLRPAELVPLTYSQENYTELLWFFEGYTSYYDDLFVLRAGLIDRKEYLELLGKTLSSVAQTPGAEAQSVAQASFEAWTRYYRPDENTVNSTVSYYTKGSLVALCMDLTLRAQGHGTLDDVMRALWTRTGAGRSEARAGHQTGGALRESDLLAVLKEQTGRSWQRELRAWVHSTEPLPIDRLLRTQGVHVQAQALTLSEALGLRAQDSAGKVLLQSVFHKGAAEAAGLSAGDEWLAVNGWRLTQLEQFKAHAPDWWSAALAGASSAKAESKGKGMNKARTSATASAELLISRDGRLLTLTLPPAQNTRASLRVLGETVTAQSSWPMC